MTQRKEQSHNTHPSNVICLRTCKYMSPNRTAPLALKAPIAIKDVCFSCLLKCLRSLYDKQCGPRSDCSYRSSLIWVHPFCSILKFVSNVRQLFAADDFSRRHFSDAFFLGALRVRMSVAVLIVALSLLVATFVLC